MPHMKIDDDPQSIHLNSSLIYIVDDDIEDDEDSDQDEDVLETSESANNDSIEE